MMRDPKKDGNIVIKSLVGVEGYKIRENEIFSYMRLNCDGGEFYYDGESIGDTFDFECSIMKVSFQENFIMTPETSHAY